MMRSHILMAVSVLALCGCEAVAIGVATPGIIKQDRVNLTNSSYAAADMLIQQSGKRLNRSMPLMVSDLHEIIDINQKGAKPSPKLGAVIREQIETRFAQLGYNVIDPVPSYVSARKSGAEVIGTYEIVKSGFNGTLQVSLKVRDNGDGKIIGLYDYSLPMTYDLRKYTPDGDGILAPLISN
jgi:hypothetical protein